MGVKTGEDLVGDVPAQRSRQVEGRLRLDRATRSLAQRFVGREGVKQRNLPGAQAFDRDAMRAAGDQQRFAAVVEVDIGRTFERRLVDLPDVQDGTTRLDQPYRRMQNEAQPRVRLVAHGCQCREVERRCVGLDSLL